MERVRWIEVKGKQILYIDYSGLKNTEELAAVLNRQVQMIAMQPNKCLALNNFTDAALSSEFMDMIKTAGKKITVNPEKSAVLGITGVKGILFQAYLHFTGDKFTKACNNEAEAIEYLVS